MTALFFAVVGVVYDRTHTRDMLVLDGLAKRMPVTAVFFTIAGLTSLGLPGLSGFVAELLVFLGPVQDVPDTGILHTGDHRRGDNGGVHSAHRSLAAGKVAPSKVDFLVNLMDGTDRRMSSPLPERFLPRQ